MFFHHLPCRVAGRHVCFQGTFQPPSFSPASSQSPCAAFVRRFDVDMLRASIARAAVGVGHFLLRPRCPRNKRCYPKGKSLALQSMRQRETRSQTPRRSVDCALLKRTHRCSARFEPNSILVPRPPSVSLDAFPHLSTSAAFRIFPPASPLPPPASSLPPSPCPVTSPHRPSCRRPAQGAGSAEPSRAAGGGHRRGSSQ